MILGYVTITDIDSVLLTDGAQCRFDQGPCATAVTRKGDHSDEWLVDRRPGRVNHTVIAEHDFSQSSTAQPSSSGKSFVTGVSCPRGNWPRA